METIPDGFVTIQIQLPPEVLADLRIAACRFRLSIGEGLTQLLARGVGLHLTGGSV
jgi:hypothetical protein